MKFNLEHGSGNTIHSYSADAIKIVLGPANAQTNALPQHRTITTSMILTPEVLIEGWIAPNEALALAHMEQILEIEPEIIVLGTGQRIQFPAPALMAHCQSQRVGLEVMDTGGACRTYNILAAEGRRVCAAFMKI